METATKENEELVSKVCDGVRLALKNKSTVTEGHLLVYEIWHCVMEVNSGASFEQYFSWSRLDEISRIVGQFEAVGLTEAAQIAAEAISVAYPNGLPPIPNDKEELSDWDGSEEQVERLDELAERFTAYNGTIINKLADYVRQIGV